MDIQSLVGFVLESCRFSRSSYTFEFSGRLDGRHVSLLVSTSFSVSAFGEERVDACSRLSLFAWPLLEREVMGVQVNEQTFEVRFDLGEGRGFMVWSDAPPVDNLLLVSDGSSGDWVPVL